jgi:cytochrome c-type biogenesis protein CcsB
MVPPPAGAAHQMDPWHHVMDMLGSVSDVEGAQVEFGLKTPMAALPGYTTTQADAVRGALENLLIGWEKGDAGMVNKGMNGFADVLPGIDKEGYRSEGKRVTELWYNRTFYGTILNVFLYFISMTLFLMVAVGVTKKLETPALWVFGVAVVTHVAAMGVRWWLAGRIPIQNEFESVLGSAMIGCVVGLMLELWKRKGIFGAAFSFVGFLAMTACFSCQYVFGKDIGGSIGRVKGILSTYWLYIHVNIVISSYALIAASFLIGVLFLGMKLWYWINPLEEGTMNDERGTMKGRGGGTGVLAKEAVRVEPELVAGRARVLEGLDQANMVILQMAFWFLGTGIICGAVWADHSWGRPWGWDPKETFALVTWIVYLVIVHLRFVTPGRTQKDWTAWLSVVGFAVMMFNWIGVNFWLVGLHSYA